MKNRSGRFCGRLSLTETQPNQMRAEIFLRSMLDRGRWGRFGHRRRRRRTGALFFGERLGFALERHFEQCIHLRNRLHNYCADCSVRFRELSTDELAERALRALHEPVRYRPVETDGAARAAREIVAAMENRAWAQA